MEALLHPYFDELRIENCRINNKNLPELFNFFDCEICIFILQIMYTNIKNLF